MSKQINIGGRIHSTEVGNVSVGANEVLDDTKGKKQNVINADVDAELLRLDQSKQNNLTFDNTPTENSTNPVTSGGVYAANITLHELIEAILVLIPSAASALNQLADKAFVNSSVSTATATFRGTYNVVTDLELAYDATHEQIATKLGQVIATADNNDYAFVQVPVSATSTDIRRTERYKFNGTVWGYEYDLNTSGFTAVQWEAINSAITAALVQKLSALPTAQELAAALLGKQDVLTFDNAPASGSSNPVKSGGVYTAVNDEKVARENADTGFGNRITAIENVIPSAASSSNKLVDNSAMADAIGVVTALIDQMDATFNLTTTDGHITLHVTQVDGVITSVQVQSSDIASAAALTLVTNDLSALTTRVGTAEGNITSLTGRVSTNETDIANLQTLYNNLQQSKPVPVTSLPGSGQQQGVIYRLAGTTSYSDYMWNGSSWVLMATYNNAIDDEPTYNSDNLVKSGGVFPISSSVRRYNVVQPYEETLNAFVLPDGSIRTGYTYSNIYKYEITGGACYNFKAYFGGVSADLKTVTFYDTNGTFISNDKPANNNYQSDYFVAPDNAKYVYITCTIQIVCWLKSLDEFISSTLLDSKINVNKESISEIQSISPVETVNGYYLDEKGVPVAFSSLNYKKYGVEGGKRYLFTSGFPASITVYAVYWYDVFDNYIIKEAYKGSNSNTLWEDQEIEAPANAVYARIVYFNANIVDLKQYADVIFSRDLQKQIGGLDGDIDELRGVVKELITLIPEITYGAFYSTGGVIVQNQWVNIYKYSVTPNTDYIFSSSLSGLSADLYYVYYFDSNGDYISRDVQYNNVTAVDVKVTTPANCAYLCINCHSNLTASLKRRGNYILSRDLRRDLDTLKKTRTKVVINHLDRNIIGSIGNDSRELIFYVRARYNSSKDIIVTHYINGNLCLTFMNTYIGSNTLSDEQLINNTYLLSEHQDSTAPLFQADEFWHLFAQHGYLVPLMDNSTGLTSEDVGSIWKDQLDRQYKIGFVTQDKVYLLPVWYQEGGHTVRGWKGISSDPITTLTYISGGTHTSTITVSGLSSTQLRPVMSLKNRTWLVDGKEVTQTGTYYCDEFVVSESAVGYDPSTIIDMFGAAGNNIDLTGATPMINFTFSYRYVGAQCCVNTTIDIRREIKALLYGAIQQQFFWDNGDYKAMMMIPKAKINRGIEIDKPFNSANSSALLHFVSRNSDGLKDVDDQIDRCIGFLRNPNTGDYLIGMAAGLSLVSGETVKTKRNQNNLMDSSLLDFDPAQRNKFYIAAFNNSPYEANNDGYFPNTLFKEVNYYVSYFDPAENVGQVYWYKDGNDYVIYCHCQSTQNRIAVNVPDFMEGLSLSVVEKTTDTELLTDTIQNGKFFLNYNSNNANYIVLKTK